MAHKIAIIVGSLRKDSLNRRVARSICAFAGDMLNCEIVEIGDLPLYNQDLDPDPPQASTRLGTPFCPSTPAEYEWLIARSPMPLARAASTSGCSPAS